MADTDGPADWVTRGSSDYRPLPTGPGSPVMDTRPLFPMGWYSE